MEKRKVEIVSSFILGVVALVWGTTFAVIKDTLNSVPPFSLLMMRFVFSSLLLSIIYFKKLRKIRIVDLKRGSIIGIFMALAFYFLVVSIRFTTASKFSFIIGAYVLIVPFLSWIFNRKKLERYATLGAIIATIGLAFLTIERGVAFNLWDLVAGCSSLFFAFHMVAIEKYAKDSDPIILTIVQFIITAIMYSILTGVCEGYDFSLLPKIKWTLAYLVVVSTIIPFATQNLVQKYISSTTTAVILTLQSVFGSIFAVYYLNEKMSPQMILGCILIFIGILLQELKRKI